MVNTVDIQTIEDGSRNLIIKIDIIGDGSGEESKTVILDASSYFNPTINKKVMSVDYQLDGFSAFLEWDATVDKQIITLDEGIHEYVDWECEYIGGYSNTYFAGRTGDILLSTNGLGSGDRGYIILYVKNKRA